MATGIGSLVVPCEQCGAEVKRSPSTLALANGRAFCGAACYQAHRKGRPADKPRADKGARRSPYTMRPCATCGTLVERRVSDTRDKSYCSRACFGQSVRGSGRGRPVAAELGTVKVGAGGYLLQYVGIGSPHASRGWALQHRLVMAGILGRPLLRNENVHHINGDPQDNRPENLELWVTQQPKGQRVDDVVAWAREVLNLYGHLVPTEGVTP